MFSEEHLYSIALRRTNLIGDINFQKLVEAVGSAKEVWEISKSGLKEITGIGSKISKEIGNSESLKFAENELKFCEKNNIDILLRHKNQLPALLNECEDAPAILYKKGIFNELKKKVSIVGTRNITAYGKQFIEDFTDALKNQNCITISGLALGADTEVHQFSLKNKIETAGVLAHGFHTFYPSKNKKLSTEMIDLGGCLFTEFNSSQKPDRENFIQRNRLIAGLSPATIVVESAFGGGSISTATFANSYNRDVFALPGKISDKYSQGCNHLILNNKAQIISTIDSLLEQLRFTEPKEKTAELFPTSEIKKMLTESQQNIYNIIADSPKITLDDLAQKMELPSYKISGIILELELLGVLKSFSGKQFSVI
ncbi:DNA-processing protein DprA [Halpernia frigidisoli]|uniref:DNA processing protein n=1 Tax=Halpernia frigidisoli TaxID=1125876 RepID=A0A1I3HGJ5_9FLAO|nr:DNA-processing protein DprA [Halpernia frigidisoli]SFI34875.1 DNA processing protein [Halpernia frigidisoli]